MHQDETIDMLWLENSNRFAFFSAETDGISMRSCRITDKILCSMLNIKGAVRKFQLYKLHKPVEATLAESVESGCCSCFLLSLEIHWHLSSASHRINFAISCHILHRIIFIGIRKIFLWFRKIKYKMWMKFSNRTIRNGTEWNRVTFIRSFRWLLCCWRYGPRKKKLLFRFFEHINRTQNAWMREWEREYTSTDVHNLLRQYCYADIGFRQIGLFERISDVQVYAENKFFVWNLKK